MSDEWVFIEIARWVSSFILAYVGYFLGVRSQKKQELREYITGIVKDEYPALFQEMKFNSEILDDYLEQPNINFNFPEVERIYDRGLEEFMKRHHKDLYLMVDSFHKDILPKFKELSVGELMNRLFDVSKRVLRDSLPREAVDKSDRIAIDISQQTLGYYIIPDLLNHRDVEVRNKIEGCIVDRTSQIYKKRAGRRVVIRGQIEGINYEGISQKILQKGKSEAKYLVEKFKKLKKEYDNEVKGKLLPLLQRYISNPV